MKLKAAKDEASLDLLDAGSQVKQVQEPRVPLLIQKRISVFEEDNHHKTKGKKSDPMKTQK